MSKKKTVHGRGAPIESQTYWSIDDIVELIGRRNDIPEVLEEARAYFEALGREAEVTIADNGYTDTGVDKITAGVDKEAFDPHMVIDMLAGRWPRDFRFRLPPRIELDRAWEITFGNHLLGSEPAYRTWQGHLLDDLPLPIHDCVCFAIGCPVQWTFRNETGSDHKSDEYFRFNNILAGLVAKSELSASQVSGKTLLSPVQVRAVALNCAFLYLSEKYVAEWIVPLRGNPAAAGGSDPGKRDAEFGFSPKKVTTQARRRIDLGQYLEFIEKNAPKDWGDLSKSWPISSRVLAQVFLQQCPQYKSTSLRTIENDLKESGPSFGKGSKFVGLGKLRKFFVDLADASPRTAGQPPSR